MTAAESGTPLPRKLGIKDASRVLVLAKPDAFDLDAHLPGVPVHHRPVHDAYDVILLFCRDAATLSLRCGQARERLTLAGGLWVCWPKKASGVATDLGEQMVREQGLDCGLVDVKIAAIDATWSGLKFVRRLGDRGS
jgi:hypothetical protein